MQPSTECDVCGRPVRSVVAHKILWHEDYRPTYLNNLLDEIEPHGVGRIPDETPIDLLRKLDPKCERILILSNVLVSMGVVFRAHERHSGDVEGMLDDLNRTIEQFAGVTVLPPDQEMMVAAAKGRLGRVPISQIEREIDRALQLGGTRDGLLLPIERLTKLLPLGRVAAESTKYFVTPRMIVNKIKIRDMLQRYSGPEGARNAVTDLLLAHTSHVDTPTNEIPVDESRALCEAVTAAMTDSCDVEEPRTRASANATTRIPSPEHLKSAVHLPVTTSTTSVSTPSVCTKDSRKSAAQLSFYCDMCSRRFKDEAAMVDHKVHRHAEYLEQWRATVQYHVQVCGIVSRSTLSMPENVAAALDPGLKKYLVLSTHIVLLDYIRQTLAYMWDVFVVTAELRRLIEYDPMIPVVPTPLSRADAQLLGTVVFVMAINATPLTCDVCGRSSRDPVSLVQHKIQKHREVMKEVSSRLVALIRHPPGVCSVRDIPLPEFIVRSLTGADTESLLVTSSALITSQLAEQLLMQHGSFAVVQREITQLLYVYLRIVAGPTDVERIRKWLRKATYTSSCKSCRTSKALGRLIEASPDYFLCINCLAKHSFCPGCGAMDVDARDSSSTVFRTDPSDGNSYCPQCWAAWDAGYSEYDMSQEAES